MIKRYCFTMESRASGGQTWKTSGEFDCEFNDVFDAAMRESFRQLMAGRAVYGHPGLGCSGPYDIVKLSIEQIGPAPERRQ
jgi:hypothetical protein